MGLGPLGQKIAKFALQRKGIVYVGAVDPAPGKVGKDLGKLCGRKPLAKVESQIAEAANMGLPVVSTCEELSYPFGVQPEISTRIHEVCKRNGVACLGTGVNPGFLMDYLPSVLTSVCQEVKHVTVLRVQDASSRRIPFQKKIGAGLTIEEFDAKVDEGTLRHVGLTESIHMIAASLNWRLDKTTETLRPVIAKRQITKGYKKIQKGRACGVEQIGRGFVGSEEVIRLHFRAAVGEKKSYDTIKIAGMPNLTSTISGGVNGDIATCAVTLNALRSVMKAGPGLKTMLEVPVPGFYVGDPA
jgi:4-hydroxy-tetrahydrodipicolinate reductase